MDIFTHAVVGAATGAVLGYPISGAVAAVVPDIVLGFKRKHAPTHIYNFTHSLSFLLLLSGFAALFGGTFASFAVFLAVLSHLVLDALTHGDVWGPPIFWPFIRDRVSCGEEWEWFNGVWWGGFQVSVLWVFICLICIVGRVLPSVIGFLY